MRGKVIKGGAAKLESAKALRRGIIRRQEMVARRQADEILTEAREQIAEARRLERASLRLEKEVEWRKMLSRFQDELSEIILLAAEKLLGQMLELKPEMVRGMVAEVMALVKNRRQIQIHLHPEDQALFQEGGVYPCDDGSQGLVFKPDATIDRGGCLIESEGGLIDGRLNVKLHTLRHILAAGEPGLGKKAALEVMARHKEKLLRSRTLARLKGRVDGVAGTALRARIPGVLIGELCQVQAHGREPLTAEVVSFSGDEAVLLPFSELSGIGSDCVVSSLGESFSIPCGKALLGRVLDGLGRPIDGGETLSLPMLEKWAVDRAAPPPMRRLPITEPFPVGMRAIDGLLTIGRGQRIGLFSGPGTGKSALLGQMARGAVAEVNVIALIGERGREVREFLQSLGEDARQRSIVVAATSDAPAMVRLKSAQVATAIAEYFRAQGQNVLLLFDSLTRFARAQREVGLAAGELPARRGYPPSVFAVLPRLLERTGSDEKGSITAVYALLLEGEIIEDPIAEEVKSILDGHIVLSRELAAVGHFPAIDIPASMSRVMGRLMDHRHRGAASRLSSLIEAYEKHRELILIGAYEGGSDPLVDQALEKRAAIKEFLIQGLEEFEPFESSRAKLLSLFGEVSS